MSDKRKSVMVTDDLHKEIRDLAKQDDRTILSVIRIAIDLYKKNRKKKE